MSTKSIFTGFAWTGIRIVDVHTARFEVLPGPEIMEGYELVGRSEAGFA